MHIAIDIVDEWRKIWLKFVLSLKLSSIIDPVTYKN